MKVVKLYANPTEVGWLGWIDSEDGEVVAFIALDGEIVTDW